MERALPRYPSLDRDLKVDVVVVGAGLTGITTAYLLRQEGARVALLDRRQVAAGDSAHTTAHLTYVTDTRLSELVEHLGKEAANAFWQAGAAAIHEIAAIVQGTRADCGFRWVDGFLHAPIGNRNEREHERLQHEAELATGLGFDAMFLERIPGMPSAGIQFPQQAKFHPREYLAALLEAVATNGSYVFEETDVQAVEDEPLAVRTNGKRILCDYLVIATHNPIMGRKGPIGATLFQTKLALYTSYVIGARLPKGTLPEALFWDTSDPYEYLRIDSQADHDVLIFGGADIKTGQERNTLQNFDGLEARVRQQFPSARPSHRWLGQVIETDDGLPFIGENAPRQFIATGFAGNGYTLGTMGAIMARDRFLGRSNPWTELFRVDRKPFHGGLWRYLQENFDYPHYLLRDRLARADTKRLDEVPRGQGMIVAHQGHKVAAHRDATGALTLLSPVCTHMKCLVRWNDADGTWDCPCHGSRFATDGSVLSGPAASPLPKIPPREP
jgi:glycine/D-amino acid oxidase-like deaminating enzyme/nitrite reductase/ring-hydroxylating ferredoxin subunit